MGLLLLLLALVAAAAVIGLGVWGMLHVEARLDDPDDSVLSQWLQEQRGSRSTVQDAGRAAAPHRA